MEVVQEIGDVAWSGLRLGYAGISKVADFSLRGAKEGLRLTKTALKQIPLDKLRVSGANLNVVNKINLRRLFQKRYGTDMKSTASDDLFGDRADELLEVEEAEEALSDERVQERVDKKFFDREYDPVRFELSQLQATWTDVEETPQHELERKSIEDAILDRRQKVHVVGTTLKRRVLDNYTSFVAGIEQIQRVNEDLLSTSVTCTDTRERLCAVKVRHIVGGLMIPQLHRRRIHIRELSSIVDVMAEVTRKYRGLQQLIDDGRFVDAVTMLADETNIANVECIKDVSAMRPVLEEWDRFLSSNVTIMTHINDHVGDTISSLRTFQELKYRNAMEAARMLGEFDDCIGNVVQCLWNNAVQVLMKSLSEVSSVKGEEADIATVIEGIMPDHLCLAVVQLCGKMADYLVLYNSVCKAHMEEINAPRSEETAEFHRKALEFIKPVGQRVGRDLSEKLTNVIQYAPWQHVDLDKVLHCFFVISMLVEAMSVFGLTKDELGSIRATVKLYLSQYCSYYYLQKKGSDVYAFMKDDTWEPLKSAPLQTQSVVQPLSPDLYRNFIKQVKQYVNSDSPSAAQIADNPFYTSSFMSPQDTSKLVFLRTVGDWAKEEAAKETPAASPVSGPPKILPSLMQYSCVVQSTQAAANLMAEAIARIVLRFPPLAAEVLQWCEDLTAFVLICIGDSFVSCSRELLLEDQPHFTPEGRRILRAARENGAKAITASTSNVAASPSGSPSSPSSASHRSTRVCGGVEVLTQVEHMYGLEARCVAVEALQSLLVAFRGAVHAVAPLLPGKVVEARHHSLHSFNYVSDEMLQVIMHRMILANFSTEKYGAELQKMYSHGAKGDMKVSACMKSLIDSVASFYQRCPSFPSKNMDELFQRRLVFAIQSLIVQEMSLLVMNPKLEFALMNVNKKKMEQMFVVQLTVDAKEFVDRAVDFLPLGGRAVAIPKYIQEFLQSAFEEEFDRRVAWIRQHHVLYNAADIANWLCQASRTKKRELDTLLAELKHVDIVPLFPQKV
jgi:syndetin